VSVPVSSLVSVSVPVSVPVSVVAGLLHAASEPARARPAISAAADLLGWIVRMESP
jgi:hypothetical protein